MFWNKRGTDAASILYVFLFIFIMTFVGLSRKVHKNKLFNKPLFMYEGAFYFNGRGFINSSNYKS
jgi:hypothetical protein